jgi:hypothetical protein
VEKAMENPMRMIFAVLVTAAALGVQGQSTPPQDPPHREWKAGWITHPTAPLREPIVLHFRRALKLDAVPVSYVVRVSADNRFILYANGKRVGDGPPFLHVGDNLITATVWNFGVYMPVAQMSDRTAFLLESEATDDTGISTPKGWMVEIEPGHKALPRVQNGFWAYMAQGPGEELDADQYDWSWNSPDAKGGAWVAAASPIRESIYPQTNQAHSADETGDNPWGLAPDELPKMEYWATDAGDIACGESLGPGPGRVGWVCQDVKKSDPGFTPKPFAPLGLWMKLAPGAHAHFLYDRKTLITAYPQLTVSGGKGATIRFTYAEALFDNKQHKGDRDSLTYKDASGVEHPRVALGLSDLFRPDGGDHRTFEPLWWRTWRYLDIEITTGDQPLTLESLKANFTAYPFEERAKLEAPDADLAKIWEISWRTARLDAHETYMDTPYYEQLQYIGDTRIQALISYTVAGDDRLARQALEAFNESRIPEGITRSRYPSWLPQNIPTFSLIWVDMLHDWWMYRPDPRPVRESLDGVRSVLGWFARYEQTDGLLKKTPWWSFIDWVPEGQAIPTYAGNGEDCVTSLVYLGALDDAADLEQAQGDAHIADQDRERAARVRAGLYAQCWSAERGLVADNPDRKSFSQQANILAVLYDVVPSREQKRVLGELLAVDPRTTQKGLIGASYFFRFYLARALDHAGMADHYLDSIKPWREMLPLHFSTWPEVPGETRSDSHAWSAHPIYDLLTLVAGIEPASPGFGTVRIAPHLGNLPSLKASFPHPRGTIEVEFKRNGEAIDGTVTLPSGLGGEFVYGGKTIALKPGLNPIHAD